MESKQPNFVEEFYNDAILSIQEDIENVRNFDKWARQNFIFRPELLTRITEANGEYLDYLESFIRDLRDSTKRLAGQKIGTSIQDWFERVRRHPLGATQKGTPDDRGKDESR